MHFLKSKKIFWLCFKKGSCRNATITTTRQTNPEEICDGSREAFSGGGDRCDVSVTQILIREGDGKGKLGGGGGKGMMSGVSHTHKAGFDASCPYEANLFRPEYQKGTESLGGKGEKNY